jgi:serine/threonine-protein kinase mTOR
MWVNGDRAGTIHEMRKFTADLTKDVQGRADRHSGMLSKSKMDEMSKLLARCHLKLGEWQTTAGEDWDTVSQGWPLDFLFLADGAHAKRPTKEILHAYLLATRYDPQWYRAWYTWALANFEVVGYMESHADGRGEAPALVAHTVQAVQGMSDASSKLKPW